MIDGVRSGEHVMIVHAVSQKKGFFLASPPCSEVSGPSLAAIVFENTHRPRQHKDSRNVMCHPNDIDMNAVVLRGKECDVDHANRANIHLRLPMGAKIRGEIRRESIRSHGRILTQTIAINWYQIGENGRMMETDAQFCCDERGCGNWSSRPEVSPFELNARCGGHWKLQETEKVIIARFLHPELRARDVYGAKKFADKLPDLQIEDEKRYQDQQRGFRENYRRSEMSGKGHKGSIKMRKFKSSGKARSNEYRQERCYDYDYYSDESRRYSTPDYEDSEQGDSCPSR